MQNWLGTASIILLAVTTFNISTALFLHRAGPFRVSSTKMAALQGELFIYAPKKRLAAFRSGGGGNSGGGDEQQQQQHHHRQHRRYAVFVPGLTDGLLALDYVPALGVALDRLGYSLVQPLLSSSYKGYGTSSLRQDVEELDELLEYLSSTPPGPPMPPSAQSADGSARFVLIGHSTGCQDAVFYMKHGRQDLREKVLGVVLQAPVSDREYMNTLPDMREFVKEARSRGGGEELMPAAATEVPITAARFLSLATKEGDDDMFSADLSAEERHARLGHMTSVPTAAFLSGADEFVPPLPPTASGGGGGGRSTPEVLAEIFRSAMICGPSVSSAGPLPPDAAALTGGSDDKEEARKKAAAAKTVAFVIDGANHALSEPAHAQEFIAKVEAFVASLE